MYNYTDITTDNLELEVIGDWGVSDTSGNWLTLTPTDILYDPSELGYQTEEMVFNGSSSNIDVWAFNQIEWVSQFSFSIIFNQNTIDVNAAIWVKSLWSTTWIAFYTESNGNMHFEVSTWSAVARWTFDYSTVISAWTNYHITWVFDWTLSWNSNRLKIFVNWEPMTLSFLGTIPATSPTNPNNLFIGKRPWNTWYFDWQLNKIRFYTKALTQRQIKELYLESLWLLWQTNNKKLLEWVVFSADWRDNSLFNIVNWEALTNNWTTATTDHLGRANRGRQWSWTSQYMSIADDPKYDITSTNKRTFAMWINPDVTWRNHAIAGKWGTSTRNWLLRIFTDNKLQFFTGNWTTSTWQNVTSTWTIPSWTWTHVAFVWDTTTCKLYINWVEDWSNNSMTTVWASTASVWILWQAWDWSSTSALHFDGWASQPFFITRAMSAWEVKDLYNLSNSHSKVDTLVEYGNELPSWINDWLIWFWNGSSDGVDFSWNWNTGSPNAVTNFNINKKKGWTWNWTSTDITTTLNMTGLNTYTYEFFFKSTTWTNDTLVSNKKWPTWSYYDLIRFNAWKVEYLLVENNVAVRITAQSTKTYNDWNWHHCVVVRDWWDAFLYVDNELVASPSTAFTNTLHSDADVVLYATEETATYSAWLDWSLLNVKVWNKALTAKQVPILWYAWWYWKNVI